MDVKTLLIAALAVSLAASLCMLIIFWTRRTYPGFGLWVAGHFCGAVCILLFILPRDQFPPWLTIILANYLWFASMMLNNRGSLLFRSRRISYGWEIAASVSFCALFAYFTYVEPNIAARLTVIAVYHGGFQLWTIAVLLMQRPAYFGSSDVLQVVSLGILVAIHTVRAEQVWISGGSLPHQVIALQPFVDMLILGVMVDTLLVILSHIMMNAQRLEYDYRLTQGRLEQDITQRQQAEAALRESTEKFRLAFNNANTGMCLVDLNGQLLQVNSKMSAIFGYSTSQLERMNVNDLALPEDISISPHFIHAAVEGEVDSSTFEKHYRHQQGHIIYGQVSSSLVRDIEGHPWYFISQVQDITERKQAEAALNQLNIELEEAQRLAKVGSWDWEMATDTVTWSKELYRILDCDSAQPAPTYQQHSQLYTADSMARLEVAVTQAVTHGIPYEVDLERIQPDGSSQWIIGRGEPEYDAQRRIVGLRGTCSDVTEHHRMEEALREQAIRDPLTGLFNRRYLDEILPRELHRCQRNGEPMAVAMLDIDHFKHFNDAYGHDAGDAVLRAIGDLLKGFLRASDIACRYGGEELAVILPGSTLNNAQIRLDDLRRAIMQLRVIYKADDLPTITVSIGIAAAGEQEVDAAALLDRADVALYQAKENGRNRVVVA